MKYTIEQICKYVNKLTDDSWEREQNESNYALAELITYFTGKHSLCDESHKKLGLNKEFAKKLPILLKIFNKYCKIEKEYVDTSYHGSACYEATGKYLITGKIPEVLGKIIIKEYEKNQEEDAKYVESLKEKAKDRIDLQDETIRDLYDKLMN